MPIAHAPSKKNSWWLMGGMLGLAFGYFFWYTPYAGLAKALELQEVGLVNPDRAKWLAGLLAEFRVRREASEKQELQNQLHSAPDHKEAVELLRQLQNRVGEIAYCRLPIAD